MLRMVKIEDRGLLSSYIYTNINKARQNLYIKLISVINNFQTIVITIDNASPPMLIFNFQCNQIALNN